MEHDSVENHLKALEERLLQPETRKSKEELDLLLADDFMEITSYGLIKDKADCLTGLAVPVMKLSEFSIRLLGEHLVQTMYTMTDVTQSRTSLRSSIWRRSSQGWQMTFHQGTLFKEDGNENRKRENAGGRNVHTE